MIGARKPHINKKHPTFGLKGPRQGGTPETMGVGRILMLIHHVLCKYYFPSTLLYTRYYTLYTNYMLNTT